MGVKVRERPKGSGVWWVFINHKGKRKAKKIGKDKRLAKDVAKKIEAKLALGELDLQEKEKIFFRDYAKRFLERPNIATSTIRGNKSILENHVLSVLGNKALDEITREDIKELLFNATARQEQMQSILSGIFSEAVEDGYVQKNPAAKLKKYLRNKKDALKDGESIEEDIYPFSEDEGRAYMAKCWELYPDVAPYFLTLWRTGMRTGEGIGLKPGDVDFEEMTIIVRRVIVEGELTTPKNGKARPVEMTPQLAEVLKKHMAERPGEWLFTNGKGNHLDDGRLRRRHYKICREAGLENGKKRGIHQIRHSYATNRLLKGHDITDVSKQLGHSDINLTYKVYHHWIPKKGNRQVNDLDDPMWDASKYNLSATKSELQEKRVNEHVH